jgi:hypothetical protein
MLFPLQFRQKKCLCVGLLTVSPIFFLRVCKIACPWLKNKLLFDEWYISVGIQYYLTTCVCNFCVKFPLHHHTTTISSVISILLKSSKPNHTVTLLAFVLEISVSYLDRYAAYSDWFVVVFLSLSRQMRGR